MLLRPVRIVRPRLLDRRSMAGSACNVAHGADRERVPENEKPTEIGCLINSDSPLSIGCVAG
jgi:hypothetical protein